MERNGKTVSAYVKTSILNKSPHKDIDCVYCHEDADVEDFPHAENLNRVNCESCHPVAEMQFNKGIHGKIFSQNGL